MSRQLLQIGLYHDYYQQGISQQLGLLPDKATQAFLDHYGLVLHSVDGLYTLNYFGINATESFKQSLKNLLDDNTPLNFVITNRNQNFYLFTDLPVDWRGDVNFSSQQVDLNANKLTQLMRLMPDTRKLIQTAHIGQIQIYPNDLYSSNNEYIGGDFEVRFKARHTSWNYIVFNRSGIKLRNTMIKGQPDVSFSAPQPIKAENQENALLFSSGKNTFAMREQPIEQFSLVNQEPLRSQELQQNQELLTKSVQQKVLIPNLPTPTPEQFNIEVQNGQSKVYSQMYVYL